MLLGIKPSKYWKRSKLYFRKIQTELRKRIIIFIGLMVCSLVVYTSIPWNKKHTVYQQNLYESTACNNNEEWVALPQPVVDPSVTCLSVSFGREKLVGDSTGQVCKRGSHFQAGNPTECCSGPLEGTEKWSRERRACLTCHPLTNCCKIYETCVTCCTLEKRWSSNTSNLARFETCRLKCQTSSKDVINGNQFISKQRKYCYTSIESVLNESIVQYKTGQAGQSCSQICSSSNLKCWQPYQSFANRCDRLKRDLKCSKCETGNPHHDAGDRPSFHLENPSVCLLNSNRKVYDCETRDHRTVRFCACIPQHYHPESHPSLDSFPLI